MRKIIETVSCVFGTIILSATTMFATNHVVQNINDSGSGSLRGIITSATNGDSISFDNSLMGGTITVSSTITIDKDLVISGFSSGSMTMAISGGSSTRVFSVSSGFSVVMNWLEVIEGSSSSGAGILNAGSLELNYCRFHNNYANSNSSSHGGGAVYNNTGAVFIANHSEFYSNFVDGAGPSTTQARGGAMHNKGLVFQLNYCSVYGCSAGAGPGQGGTGHSVALGGGIYSTSEIEINSSTISGNQCSNGPGGSSSASKGGNIHCSDTIRINNSTITGGNVSGFNKSGDNISNGKHLYVYNTIIANSSADGDIYTLSGAGVTSLGNNMIEVIIYSNMTFVGGDVQADPMLETIAYNGGAFTKTHKLQCSSPAINSGNDTGAPTIDQTERTRIFNGSIDIGAYELQSLLVTPVINQSGNLLSISQVGTYQWYQDNVAISGANAGNYTATQSGNYFVEYSDSEGCPFNSNTVSITIACATSSTISPSACGQYTSPSGNYTWTTSGTYLDTIPNANSCDSVITINLTINTVNVTASAQNTIICEGDSTEVTAFISGSGAYDWDNGLGSGQSHVVSPTSNTTYQVTATDLSNSCSDIGSLSVTVIPAFSPNISQSGGLIQTSNGYATYNWIFNGNSIGTAYSVQVSQVGLYTVEVTDVNGCHATNNYTVTSLSNKEISNISISLFPSPFTDELSITTEAQLLSLRIVDQVGKIVYVDNQLGSKKTIATDGWSSGVYFVQVEVMGLMNVFKVIKN